MTYREIYIVSSMFILGDDHVPEWNEAFEIAFYSDLIANRELDEVMLWMGV